MISADILAAGYALNGHLEGMWNASCPEGDMARGERCSVERQIGLQPITKLSISYGS